MPKLTKTRSVLDVVAEGRRAVSTDDTTPDDAVWFERKLDPGESMTRQTLVIIDRDLWEDLGEPTQITVSIEPGDLLNVHKIPYTEEQEAAIAACSQASSHGSPWRYCPSCPWTERGPIGSDRAGSEVGYEPSRGGLAYRDDR